MDVTELEQKTVAVLGFGQEGRAAAEFLTRHGIKPVLFDQKPWDDWTASDKEYIKSLGVNFIFGPDCLKELAGIDVAFRSPGVRVLDENLQTFARKGLIITSQTKWFFEHAKVKIIGITGTKGKGTTSTLIYEMLRAEGKKARLTGNIGKEQPFEFLDNLSGDETVVYELSSFQLQDLNTSPHIGVVLMVTQEHLNYHKDAAEYRQAKEPVVKFQSAEDFSVFNADFESSRKIGMQGSGKKFLFSRQTAVPQGFYALSGKVLFQRGDGELVEILETKDLLLKGAHNLENICAAFTAAWCAGCSLDAMAKTALAFKGLEHRLELVAEKQGIRFYNDSFSTTPETAIAAIRAFAEPEILILGGSTKNSDFSGLAAEIVNAPNIKCIILIGQEAERIKDAIGKAGSFGGRLLEGAANMDEIFGQIKSVAQAGDVVVLSPACASFGMFENYKERGRLFRERVLSW